MVKRKVKELENAGRNIDGRGKAYPFDHPKPIG
jgi:hypothetical protein